jgi:hypothetical protein
MRRLLFILVPLLTAVAVLGCPLTIEVRCDASFPCEDGQACVAGACVSGQPASKVGDACASDGACGAGLTCGTGFPGGYCLATCGEGGVCPSGAVCVPELGRCLRACGEACTRPGYACMPVPGPGSATRACAPGSNAQEDGGTGNPGDGGTGEPTPDAGCVASVPLDGRCTQACECATAGASCSGGTCVLPCSTDWDCPDDRRCDEATEKCERGPRIGEACVDDFDCQSFVQCNEARGRCEDPCTSDVACAPGYRCSPDSTCVENCTGVPETVGLTCESSLDCSRCGLCVASGSEKRCRASCQLDRDCPGGAAGACEQVGTSKLKACRPPP